MCVVTHVEVWCFMDLCSVCSTSMSHIILVFALASCESIYRTGSYVSRTGQPFDILSFQQHPATTVYWIITVLEKLRGYCIFFFSEFLDAMCVFFRKSLIFNVQHVMT